MAVTYQIEERIRHVVKKITETENSQSVELVGEFPTLQQAEDFVAAVDPAADARTA